MNQTITLSKSQIDQLFDFTRKKYVQYDDVKFEIVDHLASDIENQMSEDSELSFESALNKTYSKFPITGFAQFIDAREMALYKLWGKKINKIIIGYFTLPKLLLTAVIFLYVFMAGNYIANNIESKPNIWFYLATYIPMCMLYVYGLLAKKFPIKLLRNNKVKFLFLKIYRSRVLGIMVLPLILPAYDFLIKSNIVGLIVTSLIYSYVFVMIIAILRGDFEKELIHEIDSRYKHLNLNYSQVVAR